MMLEKIMRTLQQHPEAAYAYSQFKFGWKKMRSQKFNAKDLKKYNFIDTTSLIRREALVNPRLSEVGVGSPTHRQPPPGPEAFPAQAGVWPFDESLKRFQDWDL